MIHLGTALVWPKEYAKWEIPYDGMISFIDSATTINALSPEIALPAACS